MIGIKYKGKPYGVEPGLRVKDLIKRAEGGDSPELLAVKLNGRLADLSCVVSADAQLEPVTFDTPEGRRIYWHSTSHLMAAAVKRLWPDVKVAIGPAIDEGFYYDFDRGAPFTEAELAKIEDEMKKVMKENAPFIRKEIPREEAIKMFEAQGERYKVEILKEIAEDTVSLYVVGGFTDLCRGPHIPASKKVKAVKLTKVAGAYWRGNEKNKMLQRIYGISFPSQELLDEHLRNIEEAKQRDHRKLGKELDLFSLHEEHGPGLVYWHPRGSIVRKEMEDFWRAEHLKRGYDLLYTPHVAKLDLWNISGHTGFYKENLFPAMEMDQCDYLVKPMNCPFHILIYKTQQRSYRELPLRWAELGTVYRFEKSGVLHGLMRVRGFTQDDAHIFMREDQLDAELDGCLAIIAFMLRSFGFSEYEIFLSTMPAEHIGEPAVWDRAERALRAALEKAGLAYQVDAGGGAFYGPKIDIKIKDALNRVWQCSTVQVDFNLPERFDVNYRGSDGRDHRVIMVHRALLGSFERFFGVMIEHYKGAFPVWLAPVQVMVLPISEKSGAYASELARTLSQAGVRVKVDDGGEKIGAKIRNATMQKVPYMLVVGDKEAESRTVSVRLRTGEERRGVEPGEFVKMVLRKIQGREIEI
ncbi:MAG: threonine--tRNA ligase [Elusimicrobia bacterium]|nr:threonine--tRNA ligase [Elusimicrobiota bacterium]